MRLLWLVLVMSACRTIPSNHEAAAPPKAPFDLVGQGWIRVGSVISGFGERAPVARPRLMFDTGGGVTLLSKDLCDRLGCVPDGSFTGKRMSGQNITLAMMRVGSIEVAGLRVTNARVAVMDSKELISPELGIEGVVALDVFRGRAVTIDYASSLIVVEDDASLATRRSAGLEVKLRVEDDGPSTVVYLPLELAAGLPPLEMEVDTGTLVMILDERFMAAAGVDEADPSVTRENGVDQTKQPYLRRYGRLAREARVHGAASVVVAAGSRVMFQKIIHDGLLGHQFLSRQTTTYDLVKQSLIFGR